MSVTPTPIEPTPEDIRFHLRKVLDSPAFRGSKRCQRFLEHVSECQLSGRSDTLSERTLATELFDRDIDGDPTDTIVRVGAREVRRRLAQYYVSPAAESDRIQIDLPPGAYVPEFRARGRLSASPESEEPPSKQPASRARKWMIACACLAAAVAVLSVELVRLHQGPPPTIVDQFWKPALESPKPLLVAMAHPIVYLPSVRAVRFSQERVPPDPLGLQQPVQVSPEKLDGSDFYPAPNEYVGYGDTVVASAVGAFFASRSRDIRLRFANQIHFSDLGGTPALLIGANTNRWSMEVTRGYRFRFEWSLPETLRIVETMPPFRSWQLYDRTKDVWSPEDYILVCRVPKSSTGGFLVLAGGLTQSGTEAAGAILTNVQQLQAILQKVPKDWQNRNLEMLLHSRVIGKAPSLPEVVASHVW